MAGVHNLLSVISMVTVYTHMAISSPDFTLVLWIHTASHRTIELLSEVIVVGESPYYSAQIYKKIIYFIK